MIVIKNSQLNSDTISALNTLIDLDINAKVAFRLTRIIKELSSIVDDKMKMEKKILDKWVEKDEDGKVVVPKREDGSLIEGSVNIVDVESFSNEMKELMEIENNIDFEKIEFDDLGLSTVKIKDLIKLEFLFN